jgi:hypothetical protein
LVEDGESLGTFNPDAIVFKFVLKYGIFALGLTVLYSCIFFFAVTKYKNHEKMIENILYQNTATPVPLTLNSVSDRGSTTEGSF